MTTSTFRRRATEFRQDLSGGITVLALFLFLSLMMILGIPWFGSWERVVQDKTYLPKPCTLKKGKVTPC